MRRRRKNKKREKIIMLCSSAFVLTALTMTGVYVSERNKIQEDYVVDLSKLEIKPIEEMTEVEITTAEQEETTAVSSAKVENPTEKEDENPDEIVQAKWEEEQLAKQEKETPKEKPLEFNEGDRLLWPVVGNVLIDYNMEKPVYFSTLEQYKYNPAIIIQASEGQNITAAADGKISKVEKEDQLGNVITMELGNGYEVIYGQLTNIQVKVGDRVAQGDYLADVAAPTKFYSSEGCNVYFALKKDGEPINPMEMIK